jgi:hypothetical protein
MLARSPASPLRALTAALGACALTGALAGPALAMPTEHGPASATTSGPAAGLVRLHESGITAQTTTKPAQPQDLRSPDSVDRALAAAQGGASGAVTAHDGRFAGSIHPPSLTPPQPAATAPPTWPVHPVSLTPPQPAAPAGDGFDWGDAGIGAGGALAILLAALGALVLYRRRGGDLQGDLHGAPTAG